MNQFEIRHELETLESLLSLARSMAERMGSDHLLEGLTLVETQYSLGKTIEQLNSEWRVYLGRQAADETRGIEADAFSRSSFLASRAPDSRSPHELKGHSGARPPWART